MIPLCEGCYINKVYLLGAVNLMPQGVCIHVCMCELLYVNHLVQRWVCPGVNEASKPD